MMINMYTFTGSSPISIPELRLNITGYIIMTSERNTSGNLEKQLNSLKKTGTITD